MMAFFVAVEFVVRTRAVTRYGWAQGLEGWLIIDDAIGTATPGVTESPNGVRTTINRWGFRGHDIALSKSDGVIRILCLGESTTFGQPCDDDRLIWPARLEQRLNELGYRVEVINAAAPGQTIEQSAAQLDQLNRFQPDMVVVYHAATNIAAQTRRQFGGDFSNSDASAGLESQLAQLRDRLSLTYMLMRRNTTAWLSTQFRHTDDRRLDHRGIDRFEVQLIELADQCRERGMDVAFCTFPRAFDESQPNGEQARLAESALFFNPQLDVAGLNDAYARYNNAIRQAATRTGARLIDLEIVIDPGDRNFIDSVHLSTIGHDAVANCIAQIVNDWMTARALANAVQ